MRLAKSFPYLMFCSAVIIATAWSCSAADPVAKSALSSDPAGWMDIQPAANLQGWTRIPIPPTNQLGRAQWHVDHPGVLTCDGDGGHDMLRLDRELGDCIFHVEFRFIPVTSGKTNYNSGVFIRNSARGEVWHQAQLTPDGGYIFGVTPGEDGKNKRIKLKPAELRMKPAGEWNTIELSARGKELTVWFNGAVTCTYEECNQGRGYIAVESEGYAIEFRNLKLKQMKS